MLSRRERFAHGVCAFEPWRRWRVLGMVWLRVLGVVGRLVLGVVWMGGVSRRDRVGHGVRAFEPWRRWRVLDRLMLGVRWMFVRARRLSVRRDRISHSAEASDCHGSHGDRQK